MFPLTEKAIADALISSFPKIVDEAAALYTNSSKVDQSKKKKPKQATLPSVGLKKPRKHFLPQKGGTSKGDFEHQSDEEKENKEEDGTSNGESYREFSYFFCLYLAAYQCDFPGTEQNLSANLLNTEDSDDSEYDLEKEKLYHHEASMRKALELSKRKDPLDAKTAAAGKNSYEVSKINEAAGHLAVTEGARKEGTLERFGYITPEHELQQIKAPGAETSSDSTLQEISSTQEGGTQGESALAVNVMRLRTRKAINMLDENHNKPKKAKKMKKTNDGNDSENMP
jgi:hypothetical protein